MAGTWKPGRSVLFLSAEDVRESITMVGAIEAARAAYAAISDRTAQVPVRIPVHLRGIDSVSLFMPGYVPGAGSQGSLGMKMVSVFPGNPAARGLPVITACVVLADPETGAPVCFMDGTYLTALRTGAGAAVAADCMSREDASVVAIFGAGAQARMQALGLMEVRKVKSIRVFDLAPERALALAGGLEQEPMRRGGPAVRCTPVSTPADALRGADIAVTATSSMTPVFDAADVVPGLHINGIGSFKADMREIPEDTICHAGRVIVDSIDAAMEEAGDILIPLAKGLITRDRIDGEIGAVVSGRLTGRRSDDEVTVCKMVGVSALDVAVGGAVFRSALAKGAGTVFDLR